MNGKQVKAIVPPDWFAKGSVYQINPRNFSPEGTIAAITKELPRLAEMGFTTVYLCPIFEEDDSEDKKNWSPRQIRSGTENPKNPYRMNDYFKIDPEYGTMEDLKAFTQEAHRLGMRAMLDLVFYHIGPKAPVLVEHPEFAMHDENGEIVLTGWGFPRLNYDSPGLREYLWCNMVYYIGTIDADGFRCDVGDTVPIDFWAEGRRRIQAIKPDAVLLNEGSNWTYLEKGFDASYSFAWHDIIYDVISEKKPASAIRTWHEDLRSKAPDGAVILRDMDNHDMVTDWPARAEIVAGHGGMEAIEVLNYLIDGIPMVFCGNEFADTANLSMFANRFHMGRYELINKSIMQEPYSIRRQNVMRKLNGWKREEEVLHKGDTIWHDHSAPDQVLAFSRVLDEKRITVIANFSNRKVSCKLDGPETEKGAVLLQSEKAPVPAGDTIELEAWGYLVVAN